KSMRRNGSQWAGVEPDSAIEMERGLRYARHEALKFISRRIFSLPWCVFRSVIFNVEESAMIRLSRILLPTDFSPYSAEATKYACAFAEKFDAELHLLHVLEMHLSTTPEFAMGLALPTQVNESRDACEGALTKMLDSAWAQA